MTVTAFIIPPLSVPIIWSILVRRIPLWGFGLSMLTGAMTSVGIFTWQKWTGEVIAWHRTIFIMNAAGSLPLLISMLFWKNSSEAFKTRVNTFFSLIKKPIIAEDEVGENLSGSLTKTVGGYVLVSALGIAFLMFFARDQVDTIATASIVLFLLGVGGVMRKIGS